MSAMEQEANGNGAAGVGLSEREAEVYDRQVRLWGVAAQQRMQRSRVLFVGVTALAAEAAKNVVLAGIGATLCDDATVRGRDLGANFFINAEDVGENRATASLPRVSELNPLVTVEADSRGFEALLADDAVWTGGAFNVVVMTTGTRAQQRMVDAKCRANGILFYNGALQGYEGWFFCDLGDAFTFQHDVRKDSLGNEMEKTFETRRFASLEEAEGASWAAHRTSKLTVPASWVKASAVRQLEEELGGAVTGDHGDQLQAAAVALAKSHGEDLSKIPGLDTSDAWFAAASGAYAEVSAVAAIVGGMLAQEILKVLSGVGTPVNNVFAFDGLAGEGREVCLSSEAVKTAKKISEVADEDLICLSSDDED